MMAMMMMMMMMRDHWGTDWWQRSSRRGVVGAVPVAAARCGVWATAREVLPSYRGPLPKSVAQRTRCRRSLPLHV